MFSKHVEGQQRKFRKLISLSSSICYAMRTMSAITRRQFLKTAAGAVAATAGLQACAPEKPKDDKQLNIFSWADYLHPDAIPEFEKRYGVQVVYDTFASNEGLLARMQAGEVDYDIIVPTSYAVSKLKKLHLLKKIDKERLSNYKYLMPRFRDMAYDPGNEFSIPYTFGTTGIAYNVKAWARVGTAEPSDWDAFWDKRFAGRMTLLEDARETIGLALKRRHYSYNSLDTNQIKEALADLVIQKPLTMCYSSDQVIIYMASGDSHLSLAFSGDAHQARRQNKDVGYIIPESGASLWIDNMAIPASAPHVDLALKWIDYILDPSIAAQLTNFTYYPTPNSGATSKIDPAMLHDKTLYLSETMLDRCEQIRDIGDGILLYDRAWTELKCI
jgi:spermidine/putrescine transport system substrate-binding protein